MYLKRNDELDIISLYTSNYLAEFYLRQISILTKIPLKTCQNALSDLERMKILKGKLEGKNKYFSLNLDNIQTKSYLLQAEIHKTDYFLGKYTTIQSFVKEINTDIPLVVFGSFAKPAVGQDFVLDLLIISNKKEKLPFHLLTFKVHREILSAAVFSKSLEVRESVTKEIENNHVILNNHSFYVNVMWRNYEK